jgi:hypothetical protein
VNDIALLLAEVIMRPGCVRVSTTRTPGGVIRGQEANGAPKTSNILLGSTGAFEQDWTVTGVPQAPPLLV